MGLFEKSIGVFARKILLFSFGLLAFLLPSRPEIDNEDQKFLSRIFKVDFSQFSPAFAAFEDEFLFEQIPVNQNPKVKENNQKPVMNQALPNRGFDGEVSVKRISLLTGSTPHKKSPKISNVGELNSGYLVTMVKQTRSSPKQTHDSDSLHKNSNRLKTIKDNETKASQNPISDRYHENYKIRGDISLKEGLAFMGSMEVQWIFSDHVLGFGSINIEKAAYEIKVDQLIGDIVVSIYDKNNNLIGEGFIDMNQLPKNSRQISKNIEVFPINWNYAGEVIDGGFLGHKNKILSGVDISLYGFNEQTKTDREGHFSFYNWKKVNSRSIAMASKPGYYDSLFIIDSRQPISVPLFPESYMQAFFSYLEDQGFTDVRKGGTIYGTIVGIKDKSGYKVSIENKKPIYFMTAGFADTQTETTSSNGLFSFTGLEEGDYQLILEKDGQIVDRKWVVVESFKVSPVFYKPQKTEKYPDYRTMSPMEVDLSFFDNESHILKQGFISETQGITITDNSVGFLQNQIVPVSHKFSTSSVSDQGNFQKISPAFYKKLCELAEKQSMKPDRGLIFGFIDSPEKYQVALLEEPVQRVIYFNEKADVIDPNKEIASGFIMSGFQTGLSSLAIQTDEMILATDLVFNNGKNISVVNTEVFPVDL